jgi:NhaP-type Na+/H+ or K+/H+ antiporter
MGFLFGLVVYFVDSEVLEDDNLFNQELFFYGILPLIIFAGGFNLKKRKFFKNFFYITLYGIAGTIIAFLVISGLTFLVSEQGWIQDWDNKQHTMSIQLSMLFGATLCASDSVAALTLIKSDEYPKLFSIVFGEGMVNDAVSIILFKAIFEILMGDENKGFDIGSGVQIVLHFVLNLVVSLLVGTACAILSAFFFKRCRFMHHNTVAEVTSVFLFGFLAYVILEWLNFSGVIGVLVAGIVMGHYTIYNLSLSGQLSTCITFQSFSQLAESFLFIYLGFVFWCYVPQHTKPYVWSWKFILMQVLICLIARFCAIFVLSGVIGIFKRPWNVDPAELAIVWFAGAIRGSVAFALILTV